MTAQPLDATRGFFPKAERDRLLARIDDLEAEVEELRGRLALLLGATGQRIAELGLPIQRKSALVLGALYDAYPRLLSSAALYAIQLQFAEGEALDPVQVTRVRISIVRTQLRRAGVTDVIRTVWGVGYALTPQGRQWLAGVLEATATEPLTTAANTTTAGGVDNGSRAAPCASKPDTGTTSGLTLQGRRACTAEK